MANKLWTITVSAVHDIEGETKEQAKKTFWKFFYANDPRFSDSVSSIVIKKIENEEDK